MTTGREMQLVIRRISHTDYGPLKTLLRRSDLRAVSSTNFHRLVENGTLGFTAAIGLQVVGMIILKPCFGYHDTALFVSDAGSRTQEVDRALLLATVNALDGEPVRMTVDANDVGSQVELHKAGCTAIAPYHGDLTFEFRREQCRYQVK